MSSVAAHASWKERVARGLSSGNEADPKSVFVRVEQGHVENVRVGGGSDDLISFLHTPVAESDFAVRFPEPNTVVLMTVVVPESQRRKGVLTEILDLLEQHADGAGKHLYVGPFMEEDSEWVIRACQKRGPKRYIPQMPFGLIRFFSVP